MITRFLILLLFPIALGAQTIPDYDRGDWRHWIDHDGDCFNTRHELLVRESLIPVTFRQTNNCLVESGRWYGPFLGQFFTQASDLDVDHIIPLEWAHLHGGWRWSPEQKQAFANDFENLLLVDDGRNSSKGSRGPGEWMPNNGAYHCVYASRWAYLLDKYDLTPGATDRDRITGLQEACNLN